MALFSLRDIEQGEELCYDYNFSLFNLHEGQSCHCGSKNCRGVIGGRSQRINGVLDGQTAASVCFYKLFLSSSFPNFLTPHQLPFFSFPNQTKNFFTCLANDGFDSC